MKVPSDLLYSKSHEWVRIEGDTATVGITDYAQSELGDIVLVDLPEAGRVVGLDESFATVESVKSVSDIYAPLAGEITATNEALGAQSELVNADPYGSGWLVKIRMADPSQAGSLLTPDAYTAVLES